MAWDAVMGGKNPILYDISVNSLGVVTNIQKIQPNAKEVKTYKKFNHLGLNKYEKMDLRAVNTEMLSFDKNTRDMALGLIELAELE